MKKLSNTEAELKKGVAYKKRRVTILAKKLILDACLGPGRASAD